MLPAQIVVLAKEPRAGLVKTRLTPALSPEHAADVARAALTDTLDAVRSVDVARHLVLDGCADSLPTAGFAVWPQVGGGLDVRIAGAFQTAYAAAALPTLLVGMDTPQLTADLLRQALELLLSDGTDSVLGLAADGGWWALGLQRPDDALLVGVPMSSDRTGHLQLDRVRAAGLTCRALPVLRDIDTVADLHAVCAQAPHSRVAAVSRELLAGSAA